MRTQDPELDNHGGVLACHDDRFFPVLAGLDPREGRYLAPLATGGAGETARRLLHGVSRGGLYVGVELLQESIQRVDGMGPSFGVSPAVVDDHAGRLLSRLRTSCGHGGESSQY